MEITLDLIANEAAKLDLALLSVSSAHPDPIAKERLSDWQSAGANGTMEYMARDAEMLSDPSIILPGVKSVVSFAINYDSTPVPTKLPRYVGRVARYAAGKDYHQILGERLSRLAMKIDQWGGGSGATKVIVDAAPIMERAFAERAGLGFIGKNTMLIKHRIGSFFLLGELLTTHSIDPAPLLSNSKTCGSCKTCLECCPTGALSREFFLDARRCISYLTIEKRGIMPVWERQAVRNWLFGCDICQEVCPYNYAALKECRLATIDSLQAASGNGVVIDLRDILSIRNEDDFNNRFGGTALTRARRAGLVRNALNVAANNRAVECLSGIEECLHHDRSPTVRAHAAWALVELYKAGVGHPVAQIKMMLERMMRDEDEKVCLEVGRLWVGLES